MKKIYSILLILFVVSLGYSQTNGITYQAVILNPDIEQIPGVDLKAVPMANKDICIQFSIIDNNSVIEYQESIQTKTDNFGMVNLLIGTGDKTDGYATSFAKINWGLASKNLKVAFNANGSCSDYIEISNQPFSAVPYALSTNMANITDGSIAGSKIESLSTDKITGILTIANGGTGANTIADAKANFGLENLDNTSDANKPVSIATQIALENEAKRTNNIENTLTAKVDTKVDKVVGKSLIADSEINRLLTLTNSDTNKAYVDGAVAAITRTTLGLENVNNTNDLLKPLSTATQTALGAKVDIVVGKTLSTNDYTNAEKSKLANIIGTNTGDQDLSNYATTSATNTALSSKVDVVTGKALSTNDYTNAEKTKLANIIGTNTGDQDLSNYATTSATNTALSSKVDVVVGKALSTNDYTNAEKTKLANIIGTNTGDQDLSSYATTSATNTALSSKVDVVTGKALSTNDYTDAEKTKLVNIIGTNTGDQDLSNYATISATNTALSSKVDVVTGKALSTNDYTDAEKTKLAAIAGTNTGDQDLSNYATTSATNTALSSKVDVVTGKTLSTNDYTNAEKTKLANIIGINTGDQDLSNYATTSATNTALSSKVDVVVGKALSTNDYTDAEKTKLAAIAGTNTGDQDLSSYALLASPTFTGTVTLPTGTIAITQTATNNSTAVATTAFVTSAIATATTGNFIDLTTNQTIAGTKTFSSNISTNSVIIGKGAGLTSVMTGTGSIAANGDNSTAIGNNTIANGDNSTAIGYGAVATADNTIRLGNADITNVQTSGTITAGAITYPNIDADNGYILTTNGAGIASFTAPAKTVTEAADEFSTENSNAVVAGTTDFTLTQNVASSSKVKMFINGVRISNTAYSVMAETKALTYNPANNGGYTIVAGDRIQFDYTY